MKRQAQHVNTNRHINDDVEIPMVGFGTFQIANEDTASAVQTALEVGYRHIDTAAVYQNEKGVGEGIKKGLTSAGLARSDIFVTTKLWPGYAACGEKSKTYEDTLAAFDESLAALGLDYIDLYLIHSPHGGSERLAQWRALCDLQQSGKVRAIGVSNYNQKHIEEIKQAGMRLPDVNQIELHPWSQKPELVGWLAENNIVPVAYSSLAPLSTWRNKAGETSAKSEAMKNEANIFATMAAKYGVSEAQFLLRWAIQKGYPVLPKSLNVERMRQNLSLFGFEIDEDDMLKIETMDRGNGIAWETGDPSQVD